MLQALRQGHAISVSERVHSVRRYKDLGDGIGQLQRKTSVSEATKV